jgi:hypothetical protein
VTCRAKDVDEKYSTASLSPVFVVDSGSPCQFAVPDEAEVGGMTDGPLLQVGA